MPSSRKRWPARDAFTLVAVVVVLGMVAIAALVTLPLVSQADRMARVLQTADFLERVRIAYHDPAPIDDSVRAFRQRIPRSPGQISQLTTPIVAGNAALAMDSCRNRYLNPHEGAWENFGPFGTSYIDPAVGLVTPIGIGNNDLVRDPPLGGGAGTLAIVFPNVDVEDVLLLDAVTDTATGISGGAIQWTAAAADGSTTMSYLMQMIAGC